MKKWLFCICFLLPLWVLAQPANREDICVIHFIPKCGNEIWQMGETHDVEGNPITIHQFRCYIGNLLFKKQGKTVWEQQEHYYLLDFSDSSAASVHVSIPKHIVYDSIQFAIGVDSVTNKNGIAGGALDPIHGMYWSWQSGYIHLKLDGSSALCNTRKHEFHFHIGGFEKAYYAVPMVSVYAGNKKTIEVNIDFKRLLQQVDLKVLNEVMIPSKESVWLSEWCKLMFYSTQ